jgi:hypothetical protein
MGMPNEWTSEKKDLKSRDPKLFVYTANHLLLQRLPELTTLVRSVEKRLFAIALDPEAKTPLRLDAIKALGTLESDATKLAPLLASEKSPSLLQAVAIAIAGPDGRVESESAVTALLARFARSGDWSPQYDAIVALRYFSDDRVEPALRTGLTHAQGAVQREAIVGLGHQRIAGAVPELVAFLQSKNPQHVAAAARALTRIALPKALAPLADKKHYTHALKLAKDQIQGRFAVRALQWFTVPSVDDDLLKLAKREDGEVAAGACEGLLHRRATSALVPLAKHVIDSRDQGYYAGYFLRVLHGLAAVIDKPPPAVITGLAALLGKVSPEVYGIILRDNTQIRYRLDDLDADAQRRITTWRDAIGKKVKPPAIRALAAQLLTCP